MRWVTAAMSKGPRVSAGSVVVVRVTRSAEGGGGELVGAAVASAHVSADTAEHRVRAAARWWSRRLRMEVPFGRRNDMAALSGGVASRRQCPGVLTMSDGGAASVVDNCARGRNLWTEPVRVMGRRSGDREDRAHMTTTERMKECSRPRRYQ